ncbi:MAG: tetratricopeptide repeat protein [Pseudomonadota bacterium]
MGYPPGDSPRERYIRRYEKKLKDDPDDVDALKRLGFVYHHQAALHVDGYLDRAIASLEAVMAKTPSDWEAYAFLGSCYTMVARDSSNPFTKMHMVSKGTGMIDDAVKKDPKNILIRVLRANNSLNLPGFLGRRHFAMEDYLYIEQIADDPEADFGIPSDLGENDSKDVMAQVFYKLGRLYAADGKLDKAREYYDKSVAAWAGSRWAQGAAVELKKL